MRIIQNKIQWLKKHTLSIKQSKNLSETPCIDRPENEK